MRALIAFVAVLLWQTIVLGQSVNSPPYSVPAPVTTIAPAPVSQEGSPTVAEQEAGKGTVDSLKPQKLQTSETQIFEDLPSGATLADQMLADSVRFSGIHRQSSPALNAAAQDHADFMARYRVTLDYSQYPPLYGNPAFSHDTNGGSLARCQRHGWQGSSQEILAMRPQGWKASCWELWRGSHAHWQAVMSNTTHCGFGVATGPDGCTYYVGLFGNETKKAPELAEAKGSDLPPQSHGTPPYAGNVSARSGGLNDRAILPQSCPTGNCFRPLQPAAQPRYVPRYVPQSTPQRRQAILPWRR